MMTGRLLVFKGSSTEEFPTPVFVPGESIDSVAVGVLRGGSWGKVRLMSSLYDDDCLNVSGGSGVGGT